MTVMALIQRLYNKGMVARTLGIGYLPVVREAASVIIMRALAHRGNIIAGSA